MTSTSQTKLFTATPPATARITKINTTIHKSGMTPPFVGLQAECPPG
jgi:hypothetical protein